MVNGAKKLCNIEKLLTELGWDTLQKRRRNHKLIIPYKIVNGHTSNYLLDLLSQLVGDNNPYSLRHADDIQFIRARTNLFCNSFFPSTIRAWNSLPQDIKNANTDSTETDSCLQSTTVQAQELEKFTCNTTYGV